ncbi:tRNA-dihydrouridine synthase [Kordiimonas gwangyangensis]|uniref:oxidoreductase n=1 Tax=Kordiimonas gwangyangensis TaxID=288022 RepID=UPI000368B80B|nr:tRNA-dihydrouridine synthase [Kordiimonas gwangyangensis]
MKITVIGGGPGGLYFALLTKKARPDFDIEVIEQNQEGDTFGFGVVFSDETLDEFFAADPESYDLIRDHFAYWQDIVVEKGGDRTVIGGNGFAGCSRFKLLEILTKRCRAVGVKLEFGKRINPETVEADFAASDLIVASDGIGSAIREARAEAFGRTVELRKNHFTWMGSTRPLDAFTFFFKETPEGHFCAHTYEYEEGKSTWVIECTPAAFEACGFATMSEEESARYLEGVFADELAGHGLVTNRSIWRQFPRVRCENWRVGKTVILGDAKASAHWSIGSGTKLAMECAIGLSDAVLAHAGDLDGIEAAYEANRRTPVEIIQHAADVSLRWFEDMPRHFGKDRYAFAFALMSRSKSITWDNLGLRDADFLSAVEDEFYRTLSAHFPHTIKGRPTPMFTPFRLRNMTVPNRVVVAPMAQYSADKGMPTQWHTVHLGARATGGAGLVFTEMTCTSPDARITEHCPGIWNDAQMCAWKEIVDFIHENSGAKVCMQIGHAGRKGSTKHPKHGSDLPLDAGNWPLLSASAIPFKEGVNTTPKAMDRADMDRVKAEFVTATERAAAAGFDMVELHSAHGYLIASFLSPLTNTRTDEYGGSAENRARYPLEVFRAMREVFPEDRPISVRISAWDWAPGGMNWDDLKVICTAFKDAGVDLINVSSGQTVPHQKPMYGRMYQVPFADFIRHEVGIPVMTVGAITEPEQINTILAAGRADLVALARPHLNDPAFTRRAAAHYGVTDPHWPIQYKTGEYQQLREAEKATEKAFEVAAKLRPARRHYKKAQG